MINVVLPRLHTSLKSSRSTFYCAPRLYYFISHVSML